MADAQSAADDEGEVRRHAGHGLLGLVEVVDQAAIIRGWALDRDLKPVDEVWLRCGSTEIACEIVKRQDRPDVSSKLEGADLNSGLVLKADLSALPDPRGKTPPVVLRAASKASSFYVAAKDSARIAEILAIVAQPGVAERFPRAFAAPHAHADFLRGGSFLDELAQTPHILSVETVFDVGANCGQTAQEIRRHLPGARIFSFEPVRSTFKRLQAQTAAVKRLTIENMALGAENETRPIAIRGESVNNGFVFDESETNRQDVVVMRGDDYCRERGVERVDFLKIDTEGFDLNVLIGFEGMIRAGQIRFIETEVGMNRANTKHVYYADVARFLDERGYDVFGVYEQIRETSRRSLLRRSNFVFGLR